MLHRLMAAGTVTLALGSYAGRADACSCAPVKEHCEAYWTTAAIFRGRVDAIQQDKGKLPPAMRGSTVTFTIVEPFTGVTGPTAAVWTPPAAAMCGYPFRVGREYMVYAHRERARLTTSRCSRTREAGTAGIDLEYARAIRSGGAVPGRIFGQVRMITTDPTTGRSRVRPMRDVEVLLSGDGTGVTRRTDREGRFEILGVHTGTYRVQVGVPEGFKAVMLSPDVSIPDPRACAAADTTLEPDGRVRGRVVDSAGSPVRGITVDLLVRRAHEAAARATHLRAATDRNGVYEIRGVPPGVFIVGVDLRGAGESTVFHPGVSTSVAARAFSLAAGAGLDLGTLALPAAVELVEVRGLVFDAARAPAAGARVYLRSADDDGRSVSAPVTTDFAGGFAIAMPAHHEYEIFAERDAGNGRLEVTDTVRVGAGHRHSPLTLTLRRF